MVTLIVSDHVQGTPPRPSGCVSGKTVVLARFFLVKVVYSTNFKLDQHVMKRWVQFEFVYVSGERLEIKTT
jgi:hypothetical protein